MKKLWNQKFAGDTYLYGKTPNAFYKSVLDKLQPGKILFLGEGEGRNAVYAALKGWEVYAVDFSENGKEKAMKLAKENEVKINYQIEDITTFIPKKAEYDAVVLVFLHFDEDIREIVHKRVVSSLKIGGSAILEVFDKEQIKNATGGPKNVELLYSLEDIYYDFHELQIEEFSKQTINLSEGIGHSGEGEVIRFHGIRT